MRACFFFLTIQAPHYLNGSIRSLSIAAFSAFSNLLAILAVIMVKQERIRCHEKDWTGNPSRRDMRRMKWKDIKNMGSGRASESLCSCSTA